jgi:hypothetical protein
VRDLLGFAVWAGGLFGDTVQWRDRTIKLHSDGRIVDDAERAEVGSPSRP